MCSSNGLLVCRKSLNMGPSLYKNIPKRGSIFPKLFECLHGEHPKIVKKGAYISRKIPINGCMPPSAKMTQRYG